MLLHLQKLRIWIHRLRKKYQKRTKRVYQTLPGLPAGIDRAVLESIYHQYFPGNISSVAHYHLSGWKSAGAFRLLIKTDRGNEHRLIFKHAIYSDDAIPALIDFPVRPGGSEYAIYHRACGALTNLLPEIYLAEEVQPGIEYRYLLEDLSDNFRIIKGDDHKLLISKLLPQLHQVLGVWAGKVHPQGLIQFDPRFSLALQQYTRINLEQYSFQSDQPIVKKVISLWPQIAELHASHRFNTGQGQLIHGDTNFTNIHINKQDPTQFKLVDWEWAGFGSPFADLTSLLKGALPDVQKRAFQNYSQANTRYGLIQETHQENWHKFLWCNIERGMLDSAFLASQYMNDTTPAKFHLPDAISISLKQLLDNYQLLSNQ